MERGAPRAKVLVVDDHAFMRVAINAILNRDSSLEVVGVAKDGQEAIERCRELHPDLILMVVSMPRVSGLEATRNIKAQSPETSVLILTAHANHGFLELAHALPKRPLAFDAELAPGLLRELFEEPEVEGWDAPLVDLPIVRAVRDYLVGKQVAPDRVRAVAETTELPPRVTKRGALLIARKRL